MAEPGNYPEGAILRCACGREDVPRKINGHRGAAAPDSPCRTSKAVLIGIRQADGTMLPPPKPPAPPPARDREGERPAPRRQRRSFVGGEDDDDFEDDDDIEDDEPRAGRAHGFGARLRPRGRSTLRSRSGRGGFGRGGDDDDFAGPGMGSGDGYEPVRRRMPLKVRMYYEGAKDDPDLAYEGSFEQFLGDCVIALFEDVLDIEVRMVKRVAIQAPAQVVA